MPHSRAPSACKRKVPLSIFSIHSKRLVFRSQNQITYGAITGCLQNVSRTQWVQKRTGPGYEFKLFRQGVADQTLCCPAPHQYPPGDAFVGAGGCGFIGTPEHPAAVGPIMLPPKHVSHSNAPRLHMYRFAVVQPHSPPIPVQSDAFGKTVPSAYVCPPKLHEAPVVVCVTETHWPFWHTCLADAGQMAIRLRGSILQRVCP